MVKRSKIKEDKPDFKTMIPEYNDKEVVEILKKRNHYQPEAAQLAIKEALKRELIFSEDDLLTEEYRVVPLKKSLFPKIENETQKKKISRSISRGLLITGIIPVIFGMLIINEGNQIEGGLVTLGGSLWMIFASQTIRKVNVKVLRMFFMLLVIAAIYIIKIFFQMKSLIFMDVFIVAVIYGLIIYGLLYLIKLHTQKI